MDQKKRQRRNDLLELLIVLAMIFLVITIYVPVAIWEEENNIKDESHFRMETIYNVETFYDQLTDNYESDGLWAMNVVNAIRDSLMADSTYLGGQTLFLKGKEIKVNVPKGYDVEYDTTFGFQRFRKDTILDTTVTVVTFVEELSRNDTVFIQRKALAALREDPSFREVLKEEPMKRVESIEYYETYIPDSTLFFCPLTNKPYDVRINGDNLRVSSPITETYVDPRYFIFSFKADNHGFIDGGSHSWDR